ncbi:MAG: hypothetical protein GY699_09565 [Desulfobacteraceae bacterium]|nr:hypothetical protein [Desulfobacteraceae bacterium]
MGIRVQQPQPQPSMIQSPVPGAELEQDFMTQEVTETSQPSMVAEQGQYVEPEIETVPARDIAGELTDEELIEELGLSADPRKQATDAITSRLAEMGFWKELESRLASSVGRTPKERASILRDKFPDSKITVKKGEVLMDGRPVDLPKGEGGVREFGMDIADWGGDIAEAVLSTAIELGITAGGTFVASPVGTIPAYAAGAATGAGAGVKARGKAVEKLGGKQMSIQDEMDLIIETSGLNLAFLGAGALVRKGFTTAKGAIKEAAKSMPARRIERLAAIQKTIKDVADEIGARVDPESIKQKIFGAVDHSYEKLEKSIGLLRNETIEAAGNQRFVPRNFLKQSTKMFKDYGVQVDPVSFKATMPTEQVYAFGAEGGEGVLADVIKRYNEVLDTLMIKDGQVTGGLSAKRMFDKTKQLGDTAFQRFANKQPKIGKVYKDLSKAASSDRNEMLNQVLKGTEYEGFISDTYNKFSDEIDMTREFRNLFRSNKDSEKIIDAVIKPQNSETLMNLKGLLGEGSDEWNQFVSGWMNDLIEKNTSQTTGIFNADKFLSSIKRLGDKTRKVLITDEHFNKLRKQAVDYSKIETADLVKDAKAQGVLQSLYKTIVAPMAGIAQLPGTRAKAAWQLVKPNATAADYLLDDGFLKLAQEAQNRTEKRAWMKTREIFKNILANSTKAKVGNRTIYVSTPAVRKMLLMTLPDGTLQPVAGELRGLYEDVKGRITETPEGSLTAGEPTDEELIKELGL